MCVRVCVYRRSNHLTRSLARGRASRDLLSALSLAIRYHNEPRRDPLHFFTVILCCNLSLSLSLSVSSSFFGLETAATAGIRGVYIYRSPSAFLVIFAAHCFDFTLVPPPPQRFDFHDCCNNNRNPSVPFSGRLRLFQCLASRERDEYYRAHC